MVPLVKAVQELSAENKLLREALAVQESINADFRAQLDALYAMIQANEQRWASVNRRPGDNKF